MIDRYDTDPAYTWKPTHRHYKDDLYQLIMIVEREADGEPMAVYRGEDGRKWTRPLVEFDAKFTSGALFVATIGGSSLGWIPVKEAESEDKETAAGEPAAEASQAEAGSSD